MQTSQNIKLFIAGRPYTISVSPKEEEIVRKAADHLNETINNYSKSFEYKDHQDLFAMVALQAVANSLGIEREKSFRDNEMENKLSELDELLNAHLN